MGRVLYFDCSAGASGDMVLGALLDAGLPLELLRESLGGLMLPGYRLDASRVARAGIGATKFSLVEAEPKPHGHAGTGPARHHRTIAEVCALVESSALSVGAKTRTCRLFRRLAAVEAEIHGLPVERVHLHEVGALDSIIDIAGSVVGMEWFAPERVVASALNVGGGSVMTEHGRLPVPAPATAALLAGVPVYSSGIEAELVTPTGALLVSSFAVAYGPLPAMTLDRVGCGAGDRDTPSAPNVLRLFVGDGPAAAAAERVVVMECEIDDMNPQIFGHVMERLYAAGALEVFYISVQMKKNRPGTLLTILAAPDRRDALAAVVFRETTSIGLRYQEVDRLCLERAVIDLDTPFGRVRFKVARLGGAVVNATPEFDDCVRQARERGVPVKDVQAAAVKAYRDQGQS